MRRKEKALTELGALIRKKREEKQLRQADLEDFEINFKHYQDIECGTGFYERAFWAFL